MPCGGGASRCWRCTAFTGHANDGLRAERPHREVGGGGAAGIMAWRSGASALLMIQPRAALLTSRGPAASYG